MRLRMFFSGVCFIGLLSVPGVHAAVDVPLPVGETLRLGADVLGLNGKVIANRGDGMLSCEVSRPFSPVGEVILTFDLLPHFPPYTFNGFSAHDHVQIVCAATEGIDTKVSYFPVIRNDGYRELGAPVGD